MAEITQASAERFTTATRRANRNPTDIVSARSIQALIQWLYLRAVDFGIKDNSECISAIIELARLADKYGIIGIQSAVADKIKKVICSRNKQNGGSFPKDNTSSLKSAHIISGTFLPRGHPVRSILAAACVCGYLRQKNHKFAQEAEDHPTFAADLLREVQLALDTINVLKQRAFIFKDPVDKAETLLQRT
ncbi:hypothetical protein N7519_000762 [Penicillium mononematosum]|uniref:uncharacterized protein n=1 Tax=Penicillium mononematosum TaxID=268346 RepID=UPI00254911EC|nr:uncharacterized protein N7519_000762 [Penicillium mononematosum]KAJ6190741.1 hypothetical protein N7519_000762 [Penicillium mononematosum]